MPVIVAWIGRLLLTTIGELAVRALVGASVGLTTYKFVIAPVRQQLAARLGAAGELAGYVGYLGIDVAMTIVLSALAGRLAVGASKAFFVKKAS